MKTPVLSCAIFLTFSLATLSDVYAGSATWNLNPTSGDWNTAVNWMPPTVPNGPNDTASFDVSNTNAISLSQSTTVNGIVFNPGASAFTITVPPNSPLILSGAGIENNSGSTQNFVLPGDSSNFGFIDFNNNASAGNNVIFTTEGGLTGFTGGLLSFDFRSSAGTATIVNEGGLVKGSFGGETGFGENSSADHATVIINAGLAQGALGAIIALSDSATAANATFIVNAATVSGAFGGSLNFDLNSTAADATIIGNGGLPGPGVRDEPTLRGGVFFHDTSSAGNANITMNGGTFGGAVGGLLVFDYGTTASNATITNNAGTIAGAGGGNTAISGDAGNAILIANDGVGGGGSIQFRHMGTGGTARVQVYGDGNLDISQSRVGGVTIGSLEGDGQVFLSRNDLSVGSNDLTTAFSGTIQDGGFNNGRGGQFTKIGNGLLTLTGSNTYTGGTTVSAGGLVIDNTTGSGTGTGAVQVNGGTLGGNGTIAGTVTIGTGSGTGAFLAPALGTTQRATLKIHSQLTLNSDATYSYSYRAKSNRASTDLVVANGVTINSGATLNFDGTIHGRLTSGLVFTVISNTSADPISGNFSNLPDGSTVILAGNTFLVSYEGADGNDLTLTVVE